MSITTKINEEGRISHELIQKGTSVFIFGHPSNGTRYSFQIHVDEWLHIEVATKMHLEDFAAAASVGVLSRFNCKRFLRSEGN
jgi:hypothetical protein